MPTKNTLDDLSFAEHFLEYTSRRSMSPQSRARARFIVALVRMLDLRNPGWREEYLKHLEATSVTKELKDIFELPTDSSEQLFDSFLASLIGDTDVDSNKRSS